MKRRSTGAQLVKPDCKCKKGEKCTCGVFPPLPQGTRTNNATGATSPGPTESKMLKGLAATRALLESDGRKNMMYALWTSSGAAKSAASRGQPLRAAMDNVLRHIKALLSSSHLTDDERAIIVGAGWEKGNFRDWERWSNTKLVKSLRALEKMSKAGAK